MTITDVKRWALDATFLELNDIDVFVGELILLRTPDMQPKRGRKPKSANGAPAVTAAPAKRKGRPPGAKNKPKPAPEPEQTDGPLI